jgi:1-aminocyclopropane-1-carboxylate deaminase
MSTRSTTTAAAGLLDAFERGESEPGSNVPYAHLGGQPALNGYAALFA